MKQIGTGKLLGNVLILTASIGIVGFLLSIAAGDWLTANAGWLFNPVASYLPLPTRYQQGSFLAQWLFYGLWWLVSGIVLTLFFKRSRGAQTGTSKFGPSRRRK